MFRNPFYTALYGINNNLSTMKWIAYVYPWGMHSIKQDVKQAKKILEHRW